MDPPEQTHVHMNIDYHHDQHNPSDCLYDQAVALFRHCHIATTEFTEQHPYQFTVKGKPPTEGHCLKLMHLKKRRRIQSCPDASVVQSNATKKQCLLCFLCQDERGACQA